ncbi:TlyA family RNA methyltransferase [Desulfohalobiaceae bacterium Ax17]|uniref:TlyA family RNA methyltransferase n=1 Tax=Desulfovulcanus ferrireducens TaxID=2831190 RepID=UPI00207BA47F|nr:TlyA family RNA methyltransferase [Desulfovulcanus ferrireducens]
MKKKIRADILLYEQGLAESREKAKRLIMAGQVFMEKDGRQVLVAKPGQSVDPGVRLRLKEQDRFVSRGGYKLLTAIEHFKVEVDGKICLDVGASTGGFTDCLLQMGAQKVYALDVGHGQLHWKLRQDPRVINLEKINIRYAPADLLPEPVHLIVLDCSFISLRLTLPASLKFLAPGGEVIALVKPQFEVGRGQTVKGVVKSQEKINEVLNGLVHFAQNELGLEFLGSVPAMIKGPKGNQEYLVYFKAKV